MALNPIIFLLFFFVLLLDIYFFIFNTSVLRSSKAYASFLISALVATFFLNLADILISLQAITYRGHTHIFIVQLGKVFFAISFYSIYLFVKDLNSSYFNRIEYGIVTYFLLQYITLALYIGFMGRTPDTVIYGFSNIFYNVLGIATIGISTYYHYLIMKRLNFDVSSSLQFLALTLVSFSFLYGLINWVSFGLSVFIKEFKFLDLNETISSAIALVGVILYVVSYLYNSKYVMKFPFDVHVLIISQKSGTPLFASSFTDQGQQIVPSLLIGALTAIQQLFQEISHSPIFIKEVRAEGKTYVLEANDNLYAFLVADNDSLFLKEGLKRFLKEFLNYFHDEIMNQEILNEDLDEVKDLVKIHFPYLPVHNMQPLSIM